jgi:3-oxoacyl-[acyl-carrier protein] reductase
MSAKPLEGKNALVTGGSRGIGKAIAIALADAGANVALTYRERAHDAEETVAAIKAKGGAAFALQLETSNRASATQVADSLTEKWRALHILVNNAGINKPTDFDQITDDDWDHILAVNLKGPFIVTQTLWPLLCAANNASVIHIGSVSGQYGGPRTAHYAASKAGLISLSQVIARFGAKSVIRSNTIAAGLIASEMAAAAMTNASVASAAQNILLGRMGAPSEVADAAVFLGSDASRYITAQTINVNGGLYF